MLPVLYLCALSGLEEGGGLKTAGESSKSSDMLCSKTSSSDKEEELISASASDSRNCESPISNGGRTAIRRSTVSTVLQPSLVIVVLCVIELLCLMGEFETCFLSEC
ncbi:hypothetical protein AVEN_260115-1 [Araneus ventricosus]|uniref:Uncharacterized protein n=1 Tax=Araneus ventricosus TaxID=182803 RepID=A0A4Y2DGA5_ARAVE|nr:hypothetical protein AVEN_260115-1 [Araneus ventricosus]